MTNSPAKSPTITARKQNYDRELASLVWHIDTRQIINDVYALATRLYNTGYYSEFYGDIINTIDDELNFPAQYNRGHYNAVLTIAMMIYQFKFPDQFNQLCHTYGADNVAIWFTDVM